MLPTVLKHGPSIRVVTVTMEIVIAFVSVAYFVIMSVGYEVLRRGKGRRRSVHAGVKTILNRAEQQSLSCVSAACTVSCTSQRFPLFLVSNFCKVLIHPIASHLYKDFKKRCLQDHDRYKK